MKVSEEPLEPLSSVIPSPMLEKSRYKRMQDPAAIKTNRPLRGTNPRREPK